MKVFTAAALMRLKWVETAWNDYHILTSPKMLDSPGLAIASGVVVSSSNGTVCWA